jgi:hypothetical protein
MKASPLIPYLISLRRRLRLRAAWLSIQRTIWIPLVVVIGIQIVGRLVPIQGLSLWAISPFIVWFCAICFYSLLYLRSFPDLAQEVDLELSLKERLSTALELNSQDTQSGKSRTSELQTLQLNDALISIKEINPQNAFPLNWLSRPLIAAACLFVIALLLIYVPNPMNVLLAEREAVEQSTLEQAQLIIELKNDINLSDNLTPEEIDELVQQLEELIQQLTENPGDREKALADLSKLEENLRRQIDPNSNLRQATLDAIAAQMQSLVQQENFNELSTSQVLEQFASELLNMDIAEKQILAERFAQLAAQAAQSGDLALAQALASLSQASLSDNSNDARQAASNMAAAIEQAQKELSSQSTLQQTLNQLQSSSQAIAKAGNTGNQIASQESMTSTGQGQTSGSGQGKQSGQGQSGQGQSGGGTKADTLPPGTGAGQAKNPENIDTELSIGALGEQIFIPWERRPPEGPEVNITGQDTGQGETITREIQNPSTGMTANALIPYQYVYTQYMESAQQAIDRAHIPSDYRDLVRDYFSQLEP